MRKNLFVTIALLTVSAVCLSAKTDVNDIKKNDSWKKQSLLIKQDANKRLMELAPEAFQDIQAEKKTIQTPSESQEKAKQLIKENEIKSNIKHLETVKLQDQDVIDQQKNETALRRAKQVPETPDAKKKILRAAARQRSDQWDQPYNANGEGNILTHTEWHFNIGNSEFQRFGERVYTYDSKGNVIKQEVKAKNVGGAINKLQWFNVTIPENAVLKEDIVNSDTLALTEYYYLDPATGERHDLELYKYVYYNERMIIRIEQHADSTGKMIANPQIESEFDANGLPTVTKVYKTYYTRGKDGKDSTFIAISEKIEYYPNGQDSVITMYKNGENNDSTDVEPYVKYETEYQPDGLVIDVMSNYERDKSGNKAWVYYHKYAQKIIINEKKKTSYYEDYYYVDSISAWQGDEKFSYVYNYYDAENTKVKNYTYTEWEWNDTTFWQPSYKQYAEGNIRGYKTLDSIFNYSKELSGFYLATRRGYELLGDTLQNSYWYIYYDEPLTIEESGQDTLAYYGYRRDREFFTAQELPWLSQAPDLDALQKSQTIYYLDFDLDDNALIWIKNTRQEWTYMYVKPFDSSEYEASTSTSKSFAWKNNKWIPNGTEYTYDEHNGIVKQVSYSNGVTTDSTVYDLNYWVVYYENGDSALEYDILKQERFSYDYNSGKLTPSSLYQSAFDDNHNRTLYIYLNGWSSLYDTWSYGSKMTWEYNDNGYTLLYCSYNWDTSAKIWKGDIKEANVYNEENNRTKQEAFYGTTDESNNTVWIPRYMQVDSTVVVSPYSVFEYHVYCSNWDRDNNCWEDGNKREYNYVLGNLIDYTWYEIRAGQWVATSKKGYAYSGKQRITVISWKYDSQAGTLVKEYEYKYTYNADGDITRVDCYDGNDVNNEVYVAIIDKDGDIAGYVDSVLKEGVWIPDYKIEYFYDNTARTITLLKSEWKNDQWQGTDKEIRYYDRRGIPTTDETYKWNSDSAKWIGKNKEEYVYDNDGYLVLEAYYYWDSDSAKWIGSSKYEFSYNTEGDMIMYAEYYWDYQYDNWVGNDKYEEEYDSLGHTLLEAYYDWDYDRGDWYGDGYKYENQYDSLGNNIHHAEYNWDYDNWRWKGTYRRDNEYDADGILILWANYCETDESGDWIGNEKSSNYVKNGITYNEYYYWDEEKKDWYGASKYEYASTDSTYYYASYNWDRSAWCWVGRGYKYDENYNTGTFFTYTWGDKEKDWIGYSGYIYSQEDTDSTLYLKYIYYKWENSKWVYNYNYTREDVFNNADNLTSRTLKYQLYNPISKTWTNNYGIKYVYVYSTLTSVDEITVNATITVADGMIVVKAADETLINIASVSGSKIAAGNGTVSASVVPGIYLITIGNQTTKVLVR